MFQGFSDITGHTGNHLYNKFSELLRVSCEFDSRRGGPKAQPKSLVKSGFSAFFYFSSKTMKLKMQKTSLANSPSANGN